MAHRLVRIICPINRGRYISGEIRLREAEKLIEKIL